MHVNINRKVPQKDGTQNLNLINKFTMEVVTYTATPKCIFTSLSVMGPIKTSSSLVDESSMMYFEMTFFGFFQTMK